MRRSFLRVFDKLTNSSLSLLQQFEFPSLDLDKQFDLEFEFIQIEYIIRYQVWVCAEFK